jgi:hypothetical protein
MNGMLVSALIGLGFFIIAMIIVYLTPPRGWPSN